MSGNWIAIELFSVYILIYYIIKSYGHYNFISYFHFIIQTSLELFISLQIRVA